MRQLQILLLRGCSFFSSPALAGEERRFFRVADALLGFSVFWSVAGVLLTPSMQLYSAIIVIFSFLPALGILFLRAGEFFRLVKRRKELWIFLLLFGWAGLSLTWSSGGLDYRLKLFKHAIIFVVFAFGWVLWGRGSDERLRSVLMAVAMVGGFYSIAAIAFLAHWGERLIGFGGFLDNPNPSAYAMAFILAMVAPLWPQRFGVRLLWAALLLAMLMFVILCGSRGALLALGAAVACYLLLIPVRRFQLLTLLLLGGAAVLLLTLFPSLWERGDSSRVGLLHGALALLRENPWVGVGLGSDYKIVGASGQFFGNSHNFFMNTAIQYGLPALLLWGGLWAMLGLNAWRCRRQPLGMSLLLIWVFSSVALQFDVFTLWERTRAMWLVVWVPMLLSLCLEPSSPSSLRLAGKDGSLKALRDGGRI